MDTTLLLPWIRETIPSCEFELRSWRGVLDTTLCDQVCLWHATGRWFSQGTPVSSTNKTDRYDITEILLKVALNTIDQLNQPTIYSILINKNCKTFCRKWGNIIFCAISYCGVEFWIWILQAYHVKTNFSERLRVITFNSIAALCILWRRKTEYP